MLTKLNEIQAFIKWMKLNKVKCFKKDDLEIELSELCFVEGMNHTPEQPQEEILEQKEAAAFEEIQQKEDDDETLFWSSN